MYVMFDKIQLGSFYAVRIQWATFARGGFCKDMEHGREKMPPT